MWGKLSIVVSVALCTVSPVNAKTLKVAVGLNIPPYVIAEENRGIEYDILKESLTKAGYDMEAVYVPLGRTLYMLRTGQVDGTMSTGLTDLPGCYTDSHITYWNYAITLKERDLNITSPHDMAHLNVMAFQNARNYLGSEFKDMAEANTSYTEVANQSLQNKALYRNRTDVVVGDRYIFQWYMKDKEVKRFIDSGKQVIYHKIFEPSEFSAVFNSPHICEAFNAGLKALRESGRYQEIIDSYGLVEPD